MEIATAEAATIASPTANSVAVLLAFILRFMNHFPSLRSRIRGGGASPASAPVNEALALVDHSESNQCRIRLAPLRLASAFAILAFTFAGCDDRDDPADESPSVVSLNPVAGPPIEVGGTPVAIAADDSGVYVADSSGGSLVRIDPQRPARAPARLRIPGGPASVTIGEGFVWVASGDGSITRIDRETGGTDRLDLGVTQPGGIAAGEGSVWVTSSAANQVVRIDPANGEQIGEPIDVGEFPTDVAVSDGSVWVANSGDGTVSRIDAASGQTVDPIDVAEEQIFALALGEGGVWVVKSDDRFGDVTEVVRIDPGTSVVDGAPARVDAGVPARIAAGEGGVWTTLIGGEEPQGGGGPPGVALIDPATRQVTMESIRVGERPSGIATGAGAVWVANAGDGTVTRIDPGTSGSG